MAQDLINKHWVAEISRVSAVYGDGHILSGEMDKDRDNGELVAVGDYKEGEYYTVSAFAGDFEAKVIEIVHNSNQTMVRYELTKDCDAYFVHNPETMPNDFLKIYQEAYNYYNAKGDRSRMYPMKKHDVFTVSVDAFGGTAPTVGQTVSWTEDTGYTAA
nr:MAG TPA: hypothetical protein [Caudoviricetes sp.]